MSARPTSGLLALVVLAFGSGYFLSYFFRNVNAVLSPLIVAQFELNATQIGLLTSAFFLSGAIIVIPVAILLDRVGPRRVLIGQFLITSAGAAIFATGTTATALLLGRALLGLGVAGCLATAFKGVTVWFPRDRWATGNALVLAVGSLGAIAGTQPLQWLLTLVTWREVFVICACVSLAMAAVAHFLLPDRNAEPETAAPRGVYRHVLALPVFWRLMPMVSLSLAAFFAIQGLWANAWMSDVAGLSQSQIGGRLLLMAGAMSCGMLINGTLADRLTGLGVPPAAMMTTGFAGLLLAQAALAFELAPQAWWPWALMGYAGNIGALGYPLISRRFPLRESARAMSAVAVMGFAFSFALQFGFGGILDLWGRDPSGAYPAEAYRAALGTLLALQSAALLWFVTSRDVWGEARYDRVLP
ncbi:MFS transporter [Histidinibacterium lentulum]|nr:MFS transporter [Histidinibacterium lentulum]